MSLISDSLARVLHRTGLFAAYTSGSTGFAWFLLKHFGTDTSKTEHLVVTPPRGLLGLPLMWLGLICVCAGVVSVLLTLTARHGSEHPPQTSARQHLVRLLCWLPMILAIVLMIREAFPPQ